jgi:hypothetical protein
LLALNDHVLKGAHVLPGFVTGKLSDFAGLVVAPVVIAVLFRVRSRSVRMLVLVAVAMVFSAVKLSRSVADALELLTTFTPVPWRIWCDATDLIALAVLPVTWWLMARTPGHAEGLRVPLLACLRAAGLGLGIFACAATTPDRGEHAVGTVYLLNGSMRAETLRLYRLTAPLDCNRSLGDPAQWPGAEGFVLRACTTLELGALLPLDQAPLDTDAALPASFDPYTRRPSCDAVLLAAEGLRPVVITWKGIRSVAYDEGEFAENANDEQGLVLERAGEHLFIRGTSLVHVLPAGFEPAATDCPNGER